MFEQIWAFFCLVRQVRCFRSYSISCTFNIINTTTVPSHKPSPTRWTTQSSNRLHVFQTHARISFHVTIIQNHPLYTSISNFHTNIQITVPTQYFVWRCSRCGDDIWVIQNRAMYLKHSTWRTRRKRKLQFFRTTLFVNCHRFRYVFMEYANLNGLNRTSISHEFNDINMIMLHIWCNM